jgi:Rps23 Pro-64 3,4-dihydroxylase Tpa1-like proline 4-hydroxylase
MGMPAGLEGLSQSLIQDEKFLSGPERELLASIVQHAANWPRGDGDLASCVEALLSRAVGETILLRASDAAGSRVLEEIKRQADVPRGIDPATAGKIALGTSRPPSPSTGPRPPSPSPGPGPGGNLRPRFALGTPRPPSPGTGPRPPSPAGPGPGGGVCVSARATGSAVAPPEHRELRRAECLVFEEFLALEEVRELTRYTLARERDFRTSEVISPGVTGGVVDPEYRRSRVLLDLGKHGNLIFSRIQSALPRVLEKLAVEPFPISRFEGQITASNDGDFFRHHSDDAEEEIATRQLTFVYFFHQEPKAFRGGELRLHDAQWENGVWTNTGNFKMLAPEQNQIVFFRSSIVHEITPVECPSQAFADSRFTVNGWLHR